MLLVLSVAFAADPAPAPAAPSPPAPAAEPLRFGETPVTAVRPQPQMEMVFTRQDVGDRYVQQLDAAISDQISAIEAKNSAIPK